MTSEIKKSVDYLKEEYSLSDYEALDIVIKMKHLEAFEKAHVLISDNSVPSALESIAMNLGQRPR